jgi:hypothetical protein
LNNSLETANTSSVQKNIATIEGMKDMLERSANKGNDAQYIAQAQEVHKLADDMVSELDNLKSKIIDKTGGYDKETGALVGMKETEPVYELMIGSNKQGLAYNLKTQLDTYVSKISKYGDICMKIEPL